MPLVIGDALRGAADPAGAHPGQQPQGRARASTAASGLTDSEAALRAVDKLDKIGPARVAELLRETAGADAGAGEGVPGAGGDPARRRVVRRRASRRSASSTRCSTRASTSWSGWSRPPREHAPGLLRGRPEDRPRPRLLHRHRLRDPAARVRGARLDLLRRPLRQPRQRRPRHATRASGISIGVTRRARRSFGAGGADDLPRSVPTCVLVALPDEERAARLRPDRRGCCAGAGSPARCRPSAAKFGKQIRYAERRGIPYVWFPGDRRGGDQVKDIRSGEQVAADAAAWTPPAEDLHPRVVAGGVTGPRVRGPATP